MLTLTENAQKRIIEKEQALRVSVHGGGCSGFQYHFSWSVPQEDDIVFTQGLAILLTDPMSLEIIDGSIIDFKEDLVGSRFIVKNPQANVSCGCGNSFG